MEVSAEALATAAAAVLLLPCVAALYWLWFVPLDRVRRVGEVGFAHVVKGGGRREAINRMRKGRKTGAIPPPFPNGWFVIAESREVIDPIESGNADDMMCLLLYTIVRMLGILC